MKIQEWNKLEVGGEVSKSLKLLSDSQVKAVSGAVYYFDYPGPQPHGPFPPHYPFPESYPT